MIRLTLLGCLLMIAAGCVSPVTRRLDETNARLAHIEAELEASNKTLTTLEKKFRLLPGGEKE